MREAGPRVLILDVRIPGSAAGWSKASPVSSAAKVESGAATTEDRASDVASREAAYDLRG